MRRVPSVDALIPALYLKRVSSGDFSEALTAILGEGASGLSAAVYITALTIDFFTVVFGFVIAFDVIIQQPMEVSGRPAAH